MTEISHKDKLHLFEALLEFTKSEDLAFGLDGPIMSTVLRADGQYRNYSLPAGEFFLHSVRLNEAGEALLAFEPEDADDRFTVMEVKAAHIDKFFPMFFEAVKDFTKERHGAALETADGRVALQMMVTLEAEEVARQMAAEQERMQENPLFGMF